MYCVQCGVELQKGVQKCPLCGLRVYHPDLTETPEARPYPAFAGSTERVRPGGLLVILSFLFALPIIICLRVDLKLSGGVSWSGYVALGVLAGYIAVCLPLWFPKRSPVVFFPITMAALLGVALYVCLKTGGRWFLPFALPVGGAACLIVETVIVLLRYAVRGRGHRVLYILGGAAIALGALCVLVEFLLQVAFGVAMRWWSLYPLVVLTLVGLLMIVIAISAPLRASLHKKFFI